MAQIKVSDGTLARYKETRTALREKLGSSRITARLIAMSDEEMHGFANDLLNLLDITDPILDR